MSDPHTRTSDDVREEHNLASPSPSRVSRRASLSTLGTAADAPCEPRDNPHNFSFNHARRRRLSRSSQMSGESVAAYESDGSVEGDDDDVWIPSQQLRPLDVSELDQLLALSEDEGHPQPSSSSSTVASPRIAPEPELPEFGQFEPELSPEAQFEPASSAKEVPREPNESTKPKAADFSRRSMDFPRVKRAPTRGSPNDRFAFFATKTEETIHAPDLSSLVEEKRSFTSLFSGENGAWWLDCCNPTDSELKILTRAFNVHPLTVEDIGTEESREKFERFDEYYFVCFYTFDSDRSAETYLDPIGFFLVVFPQGLLTFHYQPVSHPSSVRRRIRQLRDHVNFTSDWICYALIDDITDSFAPPIHDIDSEVDGVEESVYIDGQANAVPATLRHLGLTRKKTMSLIRLLSNKADVIRGFGKRCNEGLANMPGHDIALYLGDILDHLSTMYQNLSVYEKILSRTHVSYMAALQMEFVNTNNRLTTVLGKATLIGTILVPMNLITGLFGMNVRVPGQDGSNVGWFFGIFGFILVFIGFIIYLANIYISTVNNHDSFASPQEETHLRFQAMRFLKRFKFWGK